MVRLRRQLWICIFALAASGALAASREEERAHTLATVVAKNPTDTDARLRYGVALLKVGLIGDETAVRQALTQFEALLTTRPDDALAHAYHGWATILRARVVPSITEKIDLARNGFAEIDAAVTAAPQNTHVLLIRAINAYQVPLLLDRHAMAIRDFSSLLATAQLPETPLNATERRQIYFHAGSFALKDRRSEAITLLETAAQIPADDPSDEQVQSLLALARQTLADTGPTKIP